jgi:hypothetical protein
VTSAWRTAALVSRDRRSIGGVSRTHAAMRCGSRSRAARSAPGRLRGMSLSVDRHAVILPPAGPGSQSRAALAGIPVADRSTPRAGHAPSVCARTALHRPTVRAVGAGFDFGWRVPTHRHGDVRMTAAGRRRRSGRRGRTWSRLPPVVGNGPAGRTDGNRTPGRPVTPWCTDGTPEGRRAVIGPTAPGWAGTGPGPRRSPSTVSPSRSPVCAAPCGGPAGRWCRAAQRS